MISQLAITEVLSAVARRKREGELRANQASRVRTAVLSDADSGSFAVLDLDPDVHREAERLLLTAESINLRTLDALHIALAVLGQASHLITFDRRRQEAAAHANLTVIAL